MRTHTLAHRSTDEEQTNLREAAHALRSLGGRDRSLVLLTQTLLLRLLLLLAVALAVAIGHGCTRVASETNQISVPRWTKAKGAPGASEPFQSHSFRNACSHDHTSASSEQDVRLENGTVARKQTESTPTNHLHAVPRVAAQEREGALRVAVERRQVQSRHAHCNCDKTREDESQPL